MSFGSLRVLNEDRVAGGSGFPTHPHRDAEIFSYILSGELTHRDSMIVKGKEAQATGKDDFFRMHRGDVQFTTGGTGTFAFFISDHRRQRLTIRKGIAHSEQNESKEWVHFLQIWATPWARGLKPRYHTKTFSEAAKRESFVSILSPLAAGKLATAAQEAEAKPVIPETIPIHADLVMAAGIIAAGKRFDWTVGGTPTAVQKQNGRKIYVHLPMTKGGKAKLRLNGKEELSEGDGAYVENVNVGDKLGVESIGSEEAEVVVLDVD
jgi:redox-sensitive bicupin YhaK (pirin superfamily)